MRVVFAAPAALLSSGGAPDHVAADVVVHHVAPQAPLARDGLPPDRAAGEAAEAEVVDPRADDGPVRGRCQRLGPHRAVEVHP